MFAGFGTGGIPGSGSDRSAIGLATRQLAAVLEAERTGEACPALGCGVRAGAVAAECGAGRMMIKPSAITAATATDTPPSHTMRLARWPVGQPILPMPTLLHDPAGRRSSHLAACGVRGLRRRRLPAPR